MRPIVLALVALLAAAAPAFAQQSVSLRARIEARSDIVTLGDVFEGAGAAAARPLSPAPAPGQNATLPVAFLRSAAEAAALAWSPPAGMTDVRITRAAAATPIGAAATMAPRESVLAAPSNIAGAAPVIRRGETILLSFNAPGLRLATRARALADGAEGQPIRVINLSSSRTVEAIVTGPGAAAIGGR